LLRRPSRQIVHERVDLISVWVDTSGLTLVTYLKPLSLFDDTSTSPSAAASSAVAARSATAQSASFFLHFSNLRRHFRSD
jgi:hypothetical protein